MTGKMTAMRLFISLPRAGVLTATLALAAGAPAIAHGNTGADVFARNCASCHGPNREGTGLGPALSAATYRYGGQRDDIVRIIRNGIVSRGMPAFGETLSDQDINALADFLPVRVGAPAPDPEEVEAEAAKAPRVFDAVPGVVETLDYAVSVELFAEGLDTPWAMAFLDADTALVSDRVGRLRVIKKGVLKEEPVSGVPEVFVHPHMWNQGGLLDIAIDPNHAKNGWIYLTYSHRLPGSGTEEDAEPLAMTRVVRGRVHGNQWTDQQVLFEADPSMYGEPFWHYGGRMAFDPQGRLYFSVGDRGVRDQAREPARPTGKIHRIMPDGSIPRDNPFRRQDNAIASVFSVGHRNPQGMATEPGTGRIWITEHGPRGGDELNIIKRGGDYGWPTVTYGINYDGTLLTPHTRAKGVEQPVYYWRPSIGVSGMTFYDGDMFPHWRGKILVSSLSRRNLRLLTIDGDRVQHEETILETEGRIYEPVVGPDGAVYVVMNDPGKILRLTPKEERRI
jgi:glucose/arabinose dehydrogenase